MIVTIPEDEVDESDREEVGSGGGVSHSRGRGEVTDDEDYEDYGDGEDTTDAGSGRGWDEESEGTDGGRGGEMSEADRQAVRREYYDKYEIDLLRLDTSCGIKQFRGSAPQVQNAVIK